MRNNLIFEIHCSECGSRVELVFGRDSKSKATDPLCFDNKPKQPTGADCMYMPKIQVKPCSVCIEKYTAPAKKLIKAIDELRESK